MPVLKKARHEKFAQALSKGNTADDAYAAAGFKPDRGNTSRLQQKDNIRQRVTSAEYYALLITANELKWRHEAMVELGASWEWPEYQPHISIQIGGDIDLSKVEPYQGKIVLGPEIFEEVREG